MRGNRAAVHKRAPAEPARRFSVPFEFPLPLVNSLSLRAFNGLYYSRQIGKKRLRLSHYEPFLYPLDGITHWNRVHGRQGFFQYQCVVPPDSARASIRALLERIAAARMGSFLAVLKVFGNRVSPGVISFPRPGVTLALDFPNQGERTLKLLDSLDRIVVTAGGAVYPAKDARMSGEHFRQYFPRWEEFQRHVDPCFSSYFWRRVTGEKACGIS